MNKQIAILVATMGGTAEMVAEELGDALGGDGWVVDLKMMDEVEAASLREMPLCILCSSTYGTGDVPDNGKALYEQLQAGAVDLEGMHYGVVGLGDSQYPQTFCFGSKRFDEALQACGATRIGECMTHDRRSSVYPEDAAHEWLEQWLEALTVSAAAQASE